MLLLLLHLANAAEPDESAIPCESCEAWAAPRTAFALPGGAYYVGTEGLSSVLVPTTGGLVLLDAGLPQSVDNMMTRIRDLGFDPMQLRYVLVSHVHYDHAGGVAAVQRRTGAVVAAGEGASAALRTGVAQADDPQATSLFASPPVTGAIRELADGETLTVGNTVFTRVATPGHTTSGSTWTWTGEAGVHLVFADSLNPVSDEGYTFGQPPERAEAFRASIARVAALPCDVLVPVHPSFSRLFTLADRAAKAGDPATLIDDKACRLYAAGAGKRLKRRLRDEVAH